MKQLSTRRTLAKVALVAAVLGLTWALSTGPAKSEILNSATRQYTGYTRPGSPNDKVDGGKIVWAANIDKGVLKNGLGGTIYFAVFDMTGGAQGDVWGTGVKYFNASFKPGLDFAGESSPTLDTSARYLYLYQVVMALLRGAGDAKTPFKFLVLSVGLDIVLNPILIFGLGPVPRLGIAGSALATLIANVVSLVALVLYLYRHVLELKLKDVVLLGVTVGNFALEDVKEILGGHELCPLWTKVRVFFEKNYPEDKQYPLIEAVVQEFHQVDRDGQTLRYDRQKDLKKRRYDKLPQYISVTNLRTTMDAVYNHLDFAYAGVLDWWDAGQGGE